MDARTRKAIGFGVMGLALIVLGLKYLPAFLALLDPQTALTDQPVILFFNVDEPCECMIENGPFKLQALKAAIAALQSR